MTQICFIAVIKKQTFRILLFLYLDSGGSQDEEEEEAENFRDPLEPLVGERGGDENKPSFLH